MLAAATSIRRSIGNNVLSRLTQTPKHRSIHLNLTSKANTVRLSKNPLFNYNASNSSRISSSLFSFPTYREYSRSDNSKKQDNDDHPEDPEEDLEDDERVSRLPALFSVPEVWPRLPVIVNKTSPIFPNFMKIFEVDRTTVARTIE